MHESKPEKLKSHHYLVSGDFYERKNVRGIGVIHFDN